MGLLSLTVILALAAEASPSAGAVVVTRRSGLSVTRGLELRAGLEKALAEAGLPLALQDKALKARLAGLGVKDPAACRGRRSCVLELGRQLKLPALISVSVSGAAGDSAVALELLRLEDEAELAKDAFVIPKGVKDLSGLVGSFAAASQKALAPPPETAPVETPPVPAPPSVVLVPRDAPPPPLVVQPVPLAEPRSHTAGLVLGGAGVAAAVAGGVLLAMSFAAREPLQPGSSTLGSYQLGTITEAEALATAQRADTLLGVGAGTAAAGLGLLVGGVIAW